MKQAMIFAAGLGTRLKPLTDTMPKAMVRVGGEPLLKRVIFRLRNAGFTHLVINVHHFPQQIVDYLAVNHNFGLNIKISDERNQLLDTGGGIRKAASLFNAKYPILIHNVDILSNVDLSAFYSLDEKVMCRDCGVPHLLAGAHLLVSWRKTKRYLLFNDQMLLVGWVNVETGEVRTPYPELKRELSGLSFPLAVNNEPMTLCGHYRMFAFSGIHTFSPRLFPLMVGYPEKFPIMDFYLQNCAKMPICGYAKDDLQLMDVGKLETLDDAQAFVIQLENHS